MRNKAIGTELLIASLIQFYLFCFAGTDLKQESESFFAEFNVIGKKGNGKAVLRLVLLPF